VWLFVVLGVLGVCCSETAHTRYNKSAMLLAYLLLRTKQEAKTRSNKQNTTKQNNK